jgi:GxxExxY protein
VLKHKEITQRIIKAFYAVYNTLGYGFLEKVYNNAMALELREMGVHVVQEAAIQVYYKGEIVGEYYADLVVEDAVIVELKAAKDLTDAHRAQVLNYLKATVYEVGLVCNFGPEAKFDRKAYDNARKGTMAWVDKK